MTEMMRLAAISLGVSVWLASPAAQASPAVYAGVGGSDSTGTGTFANPYATITRASKAAAAGAVVYVLPGSYSAGFQTKSAGKPGHPVTYKPFVPGTVQIVDDGTIPCSATNYQSYIAWLETGSYAVISGFIVTANNVQGQHITTGFASEGTGTAYIGNTVYNLITYQSGSGYSCQDGVIARGSVSPAYNRATTGGGGACFNWNDSNYETEYVGAQVIANTCHDMLPGVASNFVQGIYPAASGRIVGNVVYNISAGCIAADHDATNVVIANNSLHNCKIGITSGVSKSGQYRGNYASYGSKFIIVNNIINMVSYYGIQEYGHTGTGCVYDTNIIYNAGVAPIWSNNTNSPALQCGTPKHTIISDPLYVSPGTGNLQLQAASPALGAATTAYSSPAATLGVPGLTTRAGVQAKPPRNIGAY